MVEIDKKENKKGNEKDYIRNNHRKMHPQASRGRLPMQEYTVYSRTKSVSGSFGWGVYCMGTPAGICTCITPQTLA